VTDSPLKQQTLVGWRRYSIVKRQIEAVWRGR